MRVREELLGGAVSGGIQRVLEVGDGLFQAVIECDFGLPLEQCLGLGEIRLALPWIVLRQRFVDQL